VLAPSASVDRDVYDRGVYANVKQARCRVARHTNVVRRNAIIDEKRHGLRIDARDVHAADPTIDRRSKLSASTVENHMPQAAVDFNFALHEC